MAKVCVVGLGYVGLPLLAEFSKEHEAVGFDIKPERVAQIKKGVDTTGEVESRDLENVVVSSDPKVITGTDFVVVAVPTPITSSNQPDLSPLVSASTTVGQNLSEGVMVVYESTVYPGVSREICAPILEKESGLKCGKGFKIGYSPERVNPGDKEHTIPKIVKVVSGWDEDSLDRLAELYGSIVPAGIHRATSIEVAEMAKVIENTQRDLNIGLMNELAILSARAGINFSEVLDAAATKWNFLPFRPGLVGGHCIGVDPYYLVELANQLGYHPDLITAARRTNDHLHEQVSQMLIQRLSRSDVPLKDWKIPVLGLAFKENVPDLRNSRAGKLIEDLRMYAGQVLPHDPLCPEGDIEDELRVSTFPVSKLLYATGAIIAAPHDVFLEEPYTGLFTEWAERHVPVLDVKGTFKGKLPEGVDYFSL